MGEHAGLSPIVGLSLLLAACVPAAHGPPPACPIADQRPMILAELFFGRNIAGREPLLDAEWGAFAAEFVTPNFPQGFTVIDGEGQWQNPATGRISRERSKILLVAAMPAPDLARRLAAVIDAYKTRFRQQSVGVITREACGAF